MCEWITASSQCVQGNRGGGTVATARRRNEIYSTHTHTDTHRQVSANKAELLPSASVSCGAVGGAGGALS